MADPIWHIKRFIIPVLFLLYAASGIYSREPEHPTIALVLSGGSAKGFAHIGALKVLEAEGIPIDIIVGNSMGSIVGGLYSIGYSAGEIEQMARSENWGRLLSDEISRIQLPQNAKIEKQRFILFLPLHKQMKPGIPAGAVNGQNIINLFGNLAGNVPVDADFNKFPIRFACIGTDLETGKQIIIDHGFLPTALFSSMTIPGVFSPGKHNGHTMIDGGVVNNFPTDVAKAMGADIIIGVDIRNDLQTADDIQSMQQLIDQLINFYSIGKDSINKSNCTVLIRPDIAGYNASSFYSRAVDSLINRGIRAAEDALPEIRELKTKYNLTPKTISRDLVKDDKWSITDIAISGDYSINDKLIMDKIDLDIPGKYSYKDIKGAIDRVYGLGCMKKVYFKLIDDGNKGKKLDLIIEEEKGNSNINIGMRLNTTDAVSILMNYTQRDYRRYFGYFSGTVDISSNPGFNVYGEISKGKFPVIGVQFDGKYRKYNLFSEGNKLNPSILYYGAAGIYGYQPFLKQATIGIGIKEEYFKGDMFMVLSDSNTMYGSNKSSITNLYIYGTYDNLDDYYFPSKGTEFYSEISVVEDDKFNNINPVALLKIRNIIKLHSHFSLLLNLHGRAVFTKNAPASKLNYIGGHDYEIYFNNHLPFYGIPAIASSERFSFIGLTGLRVKLVKRHYVSFMANYLYHSDEIFDYKAYDSQWGLGINYSYNSRGGPLDLTVGYSNWYKKPIFSANIGLWF